jgi:hypothetical protein
VRISRDQTARFARSIAIQRAGGAAGARTFCLYHRRKEFWSLDLTSVPGVLIPRPDTETLIEEALRIVPDRNAPLRIADLGTGSGAILIAALKEFPNATGIGFESSQALCLAACQCRAPDRRPRRNPAIAVGGGAGPVRSGLLQPALYPVGEIESLEPDVVRIRARAGPGWRPDGLAAYPGLAELLPGLLKPAATSCWKSAWARKALRNPVQGLELCGLPPILRHSPLRHTAETIRKSLEKPGPSARFGR